MREHGRERGRGRGNYRGGGGRGGGRQYRARRDHYDNRGPPRGGYAEENQDRAPRRMFQRGFIAPPPEEESPRKKLLQLLSALGHVPAVTVRSFRLNCICQHVVAVIPSLAPAYAGPSLNLVVWDSIRSEHAVATYR